MLAKVNSCTIIGINGVPLDIEVDITDGLPSFDIIGLPDASVREAKERVRAAIRNSGFNFPYKRVTVNLAPADLKKEGSSFDLAIAIGFLAATGQVPQNEVLKNGVFVGELSLDGSLRRINGSLAIALSMIALPSHRDKTLYIPEANTPEATLINNLKINGVTTLTQLVKHLNNDQKLPAIQPLTGNHYFDSKSELDFKEVKGQETAKRALEIAAAGAHNLLLYGPPGSGKTMLARRIPSILPSPSNDERLEITKIHSVAGLLNASKPFLARRPFRSPHHSASLAGIIGGGKSPRPGEVTLAHLGVLFFDEMPEYNRELLEALRQPLEDREVTVTRLTATVTYPADFMFIGSMNPCPCGNFGEPHLECRCSHNQILRYRNKLSGPLMDRIDLHVEVPAIKYEQLDGQIEGESSETIRSRVEKARSIQRERYQNIAATTNAQLRSKYFKQHCPLAKDARNLLHQAFQSIGLSMRAHDRIIRVARTIADLDRSALIELTHIAEAIQYRSLDRQH